MKILIVDPDAAWMATNIAGYAPKAQIIGNCTEGRASSLFEEALPDVAIISLDLPEVDGMAMMSGLISRGCEVILSSEWSTFAYEAIRGGAVGYLLKPCRSQELKTVIEQVSRRVEEKKIIQKVRSRLGNK